MSDNRKVILPHSDVLNHKPTSDNIQEGELFINTSEGKGNSFLSTKKSDGEVAVFHEDAYWSNKTPTNLNLFIIAESGEGGTNIVCEPESGLSYDDINNWYEAKYKQATVTIDPSLNDTIFGESVIENTTVTMVFNHEMDLNNNEDNSYSKVLYWNNAINDIKFDGYIIVAKGENDFAYEFNYVPSTPIVVNVTQQNDGTYSAVTPQSSEYINKCLSMNKTDIIVRTFNKATGKQIGETRVIGTATAYLQGHPLMMEATIRSVNENEFVDYLVIVANGGTCIYTKQEAASKEYVANLLTNVIHTDEVGDITQITSTNEVMVRDNEGYKKANVDTLVSYIDESLAIVRFEYDEQLNILNITGTRDNMSFDAETETLNITI